MNPSVLIVVPVFNEEDVLESSITRLHAYLSRHFPGFASWRIQIADNASTDGTLELARALAYRLPHVEVLRLEEKGRGRALRAAWGRSTDDVVCYMDVDLSTDLRAVLPLVAPLLSGHSDVAIGSRLLPAARVQRSPRRELISRAYNRLLRATLRVDFSDAQCGFKALRGDVAPAPGRGQGRRLVPRHRAARARRAPRPPHPRGRGRLGRGPRLAGGHRPHRVG